MSVKLLILGSLNERFTSQQAALQTVKLCHFLLVSSWNTSGARPFGRHFGCTSSVA